MQKQVLKQKLERWERDEEFRQAARLNDYLTEIRCCAEKEVFINEQRVTKEGVQLLRYLCGEVIDALDRLKLSHERISRMRQNIFGDPNIVLASAIETLFQETDAESITIADVADRLELSQSQIYRRLKNAGIPYRKRRIFRNALEK